MSLKIRLVELLDQTLLLIQEYLIILDYYSLQLKKQELEVMIKEDSHLMLKVEDVNDAKVMV